MSCTKSQLTLSTLSGVPSTHPCEPPALHLKVRPIRSSKMNSRWVVLKNTGAPSRESKRKTAEYAGTAASLKEGLDETLTVKDLDLSEALEHTLSTTIPIENLNGTIRRIQRRVRRWRDASMIRRWVALGILQAEKGFRKLRGYKSMHKLVAALRALDHQDRVDAAEVAA